MDISPDTLAEKFIEELCQRQSEAPHVFKLSALKRAGAQLQRLAQGLAPHVEGGLSLTAEDLKVLADRYMDYHQSPHKEPLTHILGRLLLERAQDVTPEGLQWMVQEMGTSVEAVQRMTQAREHSLFFTVARLWPFASRSPLDQPGAGGYSSGIRRSLMAVWTSHNSPVRYTLMNERFVYQWVSPSEGL